MEETVNEQKTIEEIELERDEESRKIATGVSEKPQNIMLSAAAGSGKTHTLVNRIVNKVLALPDDKHIDGFVVVTFTKAAAAELTEKIDEALVSVAKNENGNYTEAQIDRAEKERLFLQKAMIGTIDAFCLDIVEKNFAKLGISPKISIDDNEDFFINEIMDSVLEEKYGESRSSEDFKALSKLVDIFGSVDDDEGLKDNLLVPVLKLMNSVPNKDSWCEYISGLYENNENIRENKWYKRLKDIYILYVKSVIDHAERLYDNLLDGKYELEKKILIKCAGVIESDIEVFKNLLLSLKKDNGPVPILFSEEIYPKLNPWPKDTLERAEEQKEKDEAKEEREVYRTFITKFSETLFGKKKDLDVAETEKNFYLGIEKISKYVNETLKLGSEIYDRAFSEAKNKNKYTFSQIAHLALSVLIEGNLTNEGVSNLTPTEACISYRKKFIEIFIDEYQDTTLLQEYIMYMVSGIQDGVNNLFNVGDVKQSIYRFRNATPKLFIEKYNTYKNDPEKGLLLTLSRNFRCRKGIILGVNEVFSKIMKKEVSDIEYKDGHRLIYGAVKDYSPFPFPGGEENGKCELIICEEKKDNIEEDSETEEKTPLEFYALAEKITRLFHENFTVFDKKTKTSRPLEYSDICILSRRRVNLKEARTFFKKCGFPCEATQDDFFQSSEVIDVISFLRVLDNPHNDIAIVSLLKSGFFGFSDKELSKIALLRKEKSIRGDFYDAILKISQEDDNLSSFVEEIEKIRKMSLSVPVSRLVWYIIKYKNYYESCDDVGKGNLRMLQEEAFPFDNGINGGLYSFIVALDKKIETGKKDPNKAKKSYASEGVSSNKIKFMTIHGSKGLEFPIVFLIGTSPKREDPPESVSVDVENGIGFPVDFGRKIIHSAPFMIIKETNKIENLKEKQRLLYVALTRAREKLYVLGTKGEKDIQLLRNRNHEPVCSLLAIRTWKSFFDMVLNSVYFGDCWKTSFFSEDCKKTPEYYKEKTEDIERAPENIGELKSELLIAKEEATEYETEDSKAEEAFFEETKATDNGTLPLKLSVSTLKHYTVDENGNTNDSLVHLNNLRDFSGEEDKMENGPAFGTLMHTCMRFLAEDRRAWKELNEENVLNYIENFLDNLQSRSIISDKEEKIIDRTMIKKFLLSDIAREISCASDIRYEIPFTYLTDINKYIHGEIPKKELEKPNCLAIQGVIDLYFKFNGRIVILDYKTDKILTDESLKAYKIQLNCYKEALEEISGETVSRKVLFHLRNGECIEV